MLNKDTYSTGLIAVLLVFLVIEAASIPLLYVVVIGIYTALWAGFVQVPIAVWLIYRYKQRGMHKAKVGAIIMSSVLFCLTGICTGAFYIGLPGIGW